MEWLQVVAGDRGGLARAITLAESRSAKWREVGQHVVNVFYVCRVA